MEVTLELDFATMKRGAVYKVMVSAIVPRPIALVTTLGPTGVVNAAPFSYFNIVGTDPALVALGLGSRAPGVPKDTPANIRRTRELVINLVDEAMAEEMVACAAEVPPARSELDGTRLTTASSVRVAPPRVAESPVAFECREVMTLEHGNNRVVLAEVLCVHVRDDLFEAATGTVAAERMHLVGRMHGAEWYCTTDDLRAWPRLDLAAWEARRAALEHDD